MIYIAFQRQKNEQIYTGGRQAKNISFFDIQLFFSWENMRETRQFCLGLAGVCGTLHYVSSNSIT